MTKRAGAYSVNAAGLVTISGNLAEAGGEVPYSDISEAIGRAPLVKPSEATSARKADVDKAASPTQNGLLGLPPISMESS
jgi:hypothetical protein